MWNVEIGTVKWALLRFPASFGLVLQTNLNHFRLLIAKSAVSLQMTLFLATLSFCLLEHSSYSATTLRNPKAPSEDEENLRLNDEKWISINFTVIYSFLMYAFWRAHLHRSSIVVLGLQIVVSFMSVSGCGTFQTHFTIKILPFHLHTSLPLILDFASFNFMCTSDVRAFLSWHGEAIYGNEGNEEKA